MKYDIERNEMNGGWNAVIQRDGQWYYIDLTEIPHYASECMAFHCDKTGEMTSYCEVFTRRGAPVTAKALEKLIDEFMEVGEDEQSH